MTLPEITGAILKGEPIDGHGPGQSQRRRRAGRVTPIIDRPRGTS